MSGDSKRTLNNFFKLVVIQRLSSLDTSDKIKTKRGSLRSLSGSVGQQNNRADTLNSKSPLVT